MVTGDLSTQRAVEAFASELARWRVERGLTKKRLAMEMGFDPSYVSHVEGRRHRPTEDFARRAEAVLSASGAIWRRYQEYEELRRARYKGQLGAPGAVGRDPAVPEQWLPPGTGLVVEREVAELSFVDGHYQCTVRRSLYNASSEPVSRYLVRISVDRFPGDPERSNQHHRDHPLRWSEIGLRAWCGGDEVGDGEPMRCRVKHDRDAFKEVWLLFENDEGRFPLYPGERVGIGYEYTVGADKWGPWFRRAVRLPTRRLVIRLNLPAALSPNVWGVETSLSVEEAPLRTPITQRHEGDRAIFEWTADEPALGAHYRLEWRFRTPVDGVPAADRMRAVGILQRGSELLHQSTRAFDLPSDAVVAEDVVTRLLGTLDRVNDMHIFVKGLGLAAPQIGLRWAAAVVRPPGAGEPIVMLNPRVVSESSEVDEQYEGCLSFFDYRGRVRRPLRIEVEHSALDGTKLVTSYERAVARLVAHEIDHLEGRLYSDLLPPGAALVPLGEYADTGTPWQYQ